MGRRNQFWALGAAAAMGLSGLFASSCGPVCRPAAVTELAFECDPTAPFTGEIHLDSRASLDTFLTQECMQNADDGVIDDVIDGVDFSQDAVFVAVGPDFLDNSRCLESRELDEVQVCSNGLKVLFDDVYRTSDAPCPGTRWTVAFTIDRADLRAALDAADASE